MGWTFDGEVKPGGLSLKKQRDLFAGSFFLTSSACGHCIFVGEQRKMCHFLVPVPGPRILEHRDGEAQARVQGMAELFDQEKSVRFQSSIALLYKPVAR